MCSILGCVNSSISLIEIEKLNSLMSHRGPDNSTVKEYRIKDKKLFLGHNRLAIQDLDVKANQPMEIERFSIIFNGEIYNHLEIRKELKFSSFKTHSDTETILLSFAEFGIEKTISKLIGMFAIALLDKKEDKLYLIRDRVGIKPLYWTFQNNEFAFSSELKGFASHLKQTRSNKALVQFMSFGYIPNGNSYYENIHKLKPAHYLVFDGTNVDIKQYWDLPEDKIEISYEDAVQETENLIRSAIKYRLLADVEVGSFLSGGVDSSLVSAIMQQVSSKKIKTFSIGFEDKRYDESSYAREVAKYIHSEHYEYIFNAKDVLDLIENIDYYFDEPFGDASALPMMFLSKKTKQHVSVALSGDGGDELFLGYDRYFLTKKYFDKFNNIPKFGKNILSFICKNSRQDKLEKISYPLKHLTKENLYSVLYTSTKPWELSSLFSKDFIYDTFDKEDINLLDLQNISMDGIDFIDSLSRLDFYRYLPDDILTKVDRSSMAYSLEARVPLLDHRVVEFAYSLPTELKLTNGPKSILKDILYKHVPRKLVDRPKKGFSVPLKHWFKNELKDSLMDKVNSLDERFNKEYINKLIKLHMEGSRNYEYVFWNIMRIK
ncbi:MAG: asparagine synthase (glutamine-hydrolyzing) [Sulfurimonas sp.]|nr:asparagine synthase (glutamine-hydrolyzing) [Sulfurimonas sp.]